MNTGAAHALGDVLYFLHADTLPPPNFDCLLLEAIAQGYKAGGFSMQFDIPNPFLRFFAWFIRINRPLCRGGNQSLFVERRLFAQLQGFDEAYTIYEALELIKRLYKQTIFRLLPALVITSARKYKAVGVLTLHFPTFVPVNRTLQKYVPERAVAPCFALIKTHGVHLKIVNHRVTRHGDYRRLPNGLHQITVNASLNSYRFLITLIHEIAHLVAFEKYGWRIKPHGLEWKRTFQQLMLPFISPEVFPGVLLPLVATHFKNPKASSSTDARLSIALKAFDPETRTGSYVFELPLGSTFRLYNGQCFRKGKKRVKRYECVELVTGKVYLFQPNAEVELLTRE